MSGKKYRTLDILRSNFGGNLDLRNFIDCVFPDVNFDDRDDTTFFKNAIAFNKSSVLNLNAIDKKKFPQRPRYLRHSN